MVTGPLLVALTSVTDPGSVVMDGSVRVVEPEALAIGSRGALSLTIMETPERTAPLLAWLRSDVVGLPDNRLDWSFVVDPGADRPRLQVPIIAPGEPGTYRIDAIVMYVVCNRELCHPKYATADWRLVVHL